MGIDDLIINEIRKIWSTLIRYSNRVINTPRTVNWYLTIICVRYLCTRSIKFKLIIKKTFNV